MPDCCSGEECAKLTGHLLNFWKQGTQRRKAMEQVFNLLVYNMRASRFQPVREQGSLITEWVETTGVEGSRWKAREIHFGTG